MNQDKEVWKPLSPGATRMRVDGGWIVAYFDSKSKEKGTFFVPDPDHRWPG